MLGVATASGYAGLTVVCRLASPGRRNSPAFLFIGDGFFALGVDDNTAASLAAYLRRWLLHSPGMNRRMRAA